MASRVPKGIRAVQDLKIAPEEIIYLVEEMAHRHEEKQAGEVDWYTAMAITGEKYKDDHQRCFCIMERMRRFLPMLEDAGMDYARPRRRLSFYERGHLPRRREVSIEGRFKAHVVRQRRVLRGRTVGSGVARDRLTPERVGGWNRPNAVARCRSLSAVIDPAIYDRVKLYNKCRTRSMESISQERPTRGLCREPKSIVKSHLIAAGFYG